MEIRLLNIQDLRPAGYHARKKIKPGDKFFSSLERSITEFGYVDPIIWNERTGNIVGGHQRWEILNSLGVEQIEVSVVDLSEEQEKVLGLALNKIGSEPERWDMPRLKDLLIEIEKFDIDIELTGFQVPEIERLFPGEVFEDNFDIDAAVGSITDPFTKRGYIYQLGEHRLMCGDSTVPAEMARLMNGRTANMVFTDPPYNVNYGNTMKDKLRRKVSKANAGRTILNDHFKSTEGFYNFLFNAISSLRPYVQGDVYICMSSSELHTLQLAFMSCGGHWSTFIIWVKNVFTIGRSNYQRQYEPILYGWFEGSSHYWSGIRSLGDVYGRESVKLDIDNVPLVRVEACGIESDIWEFAKPQKSADHPTMKPIGLCARSIRNSSKPGDLVVDTFGGSGSTLVAAEEVGRACYSMELSEKFCDVIVRRWEELTGNKAVLKERG
jgi:DNA modification methylase